MSTIWSDDWAEKAYLIAFSRLRFNYPGFDERVKDAIQAAFRNTFHKKKPEDFPDLPHFARWIATVARNELIDTLRKRLRQQAVNLEGIEIEQHEELATPDEEVVTLLHQCMAELPEESKQILTLYYFEGLNDESISNRLEKSLTTIWRRRREALAELRRMLLQAGLDPVSWDLSPFVLPPDGNTFGISSGFNPSNSQDENGHSPTKKNS